MKAWSRVRFAHTDDVLVTSLGDADPPPPPWAQEGGAIEPRALGDEGHGVHHVGRAVTDRPPH